MPMLQKPIMNPATVQVSTCSPFTSHLDCGPLDATLGIYSTLKFTVLYCTVLYCTALYTLCSSLFRESIRRFSSPCLMSSRLPFLSHSLMIPFLPFTNTSTAEEVHILCQRTCCNTNSYLLPSSLFIVFIGSLFSSRFSETLLQYSLTCASCRNKRS